LFETGKAGRHCRHYRRGCCWYIGTRPRRWRKQLV